MSNKNRNSLEDDFRSSQAYQKISKSGGNIADILADGIGKATKAVDNAIDSVDNALHPQGRYPGQGSPPNQPYQANRDTRGTNPYQQQTVPPPETGYTPPVQGASNSTYNYSKPPISTPPPTPAVPSAGPPPRVVHPNNVKVKMIRQPSNIKYYVTGIAALIFAGVLPMYEFQHFAIYAALVAATFLVSREIFKGKKKYIAVPIEEAKQVQEEPEKTGNDDVDKAIKEGYDYLLRLKQANDAIEDAAMSDCISRIEQASAGIFSYISDHPEKVGQIRKFMNYYLPTTMKLLDSYQRLGSQTIKGDNIQATLTDIDRILYTVAGAFEKQLDSLYSEEAMDISTDISVFETMLKQEGFVSEDSMSEQKTSAK